MTMSRMASIFVLLVFSTHFALAQVSTGAISGVVKDETGAVIPAAAVKVMNIETGISRTLSTDNQGS